MAGLATSGSRRAFLTLAALAGLAGLAAAGGYLILWPRRRGIYTRLFEPSYAVRSGPLPAADLPYVHALAECLHPPETEDERRLLHQRTADWVAARTEQDGLLELYRSGVDALRQATAKAGRQRPFHSLPLDQRLGLLETVAGSPEGQHRGTAPLARWRERLEHFLEREERYFMGQLRNELIRGIFGSSLGWQVVGYSNWPGIAGDPREYTSPPRPVAPRTGHALRAGIAAQVTP